MRRLADTPELLDGPLDDPVALADNLRDLRRFNRLFGGTRLSRQALGALVGDRTEPVTLLDIGTGGADIPAALVTRRSGDGRRLEVTAIDSRAEVLAAAVAGRAELASLDGLRLALGDGRMLDDPDASQDVVHASLVLHHLEPDDAIRLLREMGRVAAVGVIVNDLARSRLAWVGAWLVGHVLTGNRLTRHDAPLSVRRAYTPAEMGSLMAEAGLRPVATFAGLLGHRYAIAAVPEAGR
ncbi:MAG: methyltransferase domain-containing protein [Chloroflexota bacterium]